MDLLTKYFPDLSQEQLDLYAQFHDLFIDWNGKVNMVSRKDIDSLYERHILHSLSLAKLIEFAPGSSILDVGTGGGFPGIPLAIYYPDVEFFLVDSIGKKITVVNEIISDLGLSNARAKQQRAEEVDDEFDFVVTRAVARSAKLVSWVNNKVLNKNEHGLPNGILALKGGDLDEELMEVDQPWRQFSISDFFEEEFFETKKIVHINLSMR